MHRLFLPVLAGILASMSRLEAASWDKIDPADLAGTDCPWAPGADAEILIDRQVVIDQSEGARFNRYQRIKVYTQKGVEDSGKFAFEYPGTASISGLEARVVKPDGREIELKKSDFFVSDVVRRFSRKWKKTSMVFPELAPGDIVEYRWRESIPGGLVNSWDYCQRAIPVRDYSLTIDADGYADLLLSWYNTPSAKSGKKNGRLVLTAEHLPAFDEEDYMVPMRDLRGWVWISYSDATKEAQKWKEVSRDQEAFFRDNIRPAGPVEKKAAELIAGATTDDEKLSCLYEFCRRKITNYAYYESAAIQQSVKKREDRGVDFQNARRTLERGGGFTNEIDYLFASLCQAAGYEVRQMLGAGRDEILDIKIARGWGLLGRVTIGVKVGADWRSFSPGEHLVPFGLLRWEDEGSTAMVTGKGDVQLAALPASPAEVSLAKRIGRFSLDAEGTLDGTVEEIHSGHQALAIKDKFWPLNKEECRTELEKQVTERLPTAEVTELTWQHVNDLEYPVVLRYHLRVPAYAEQVGERQMFVPAVFEQGRAPTFSAPARQHPIMLPFAQAEQDDVAIVLPEGYTLDSASAPQSVQDGSGFVRSVYEIKFSKKVRTLYYARNFQLGLPGALSLRANAYPVVKGLLDDVHASDSHALLIKPVPAAEPAAAAP